MPPIDWSTIIGLVAIALCWSLAVVLVRAGSTGKGSRKLSALLVIEGIALLTNVVYLYILDNPDVTGQTIDGRLGATLNTLHFAADCLMLALYPVFLATALDTKLTRPFTGKRPRMLLMGYALALFLIIQFTGNDISLVVLFASLSVLFTYALVTSIHAWLTAPTAFCGPSCSTLT
jgi:hypothetical protein